VMFLCLGGIDDAAVTMWRLRFEVWSMERYGFIMPVVKVFEWRGLTATCWWPGKGLK
jgi:hypothetical protein